jgi:hypothetical protein
VRLVDERARLETEEDGSIGVKLGATEGLVVGELEGESVRKMECWELGEGGELGGMFCQLELVDQRRGSQGTWNVRCPAAWPLKTYEGRKVDRSKTTDLERK